LARKVKLRVIPQIDGPPGEPDSAAYLSYVEQMTYRWAFICQACYTLMDNDVGAADMRGRLFNIASRSRLDRAPSVDQVGYDAFQSIEAAKLGLA
jgi:hypothetical protein